MVENPDPGSVDVRPAKPPRLRALDAARGWALVFMILLHSLSLFLDPEAPPRAYQILSVVFFFAKVATPLFIWVFGMTMAYVYVDQLNDPARFARFWRHMWVRAGWVLLSREFLVLVVDLGEGQPAGYILKRLLFLQAGSWIEVLNFYTVLLLVAPWLLRGWRVAPGWARLGAAVLMYGLGRLLAHVPVPELGLAVKNMLVGYVPGAFGEAQPDTFPVFQLSVFFFGGLLAGEYLGRCVRARTFTRLLVGGLILAGLGFVFSLLVAGLSPARYITAIAYDQFKYPPSLPYLGYGLAMALVVSLVCVTLESIFELKLRPLRWVELLGRNSLFTFNFHYVLLFAVGGLGLDLLQHQSLARSLLGAGVVLLASLAGARGWDAVKHRLPG